MYPPIVCGCGRSLGDIYDVYKYLRKLEIEKKINETKRANVLPEHFMSSYEIEVEVGKILTDLGLTLECCRNNMLSCVEFRELY